MFGESSFECDYMAIADTRWRDTYEPSKDIRSAVGKDASLTECKIYEILEEFIAELATPGLLKIAEFKLNEYLLDRHISVEYIRDNLVTGIRVLFDDDDGLRKSFDLN